jgi:uncharacterized membrane protein AbrB (regulator of aidB expression)
VSLAYFKGFLVPPNDLVAGQGWKVTLERLLARSRHVLVLRTMLKEFLNFEKWGYFALILPWYGLLMGARIDRRTRPLVLTAVLAFALILIGYYLVYVTTPLTLSWHLKTSLSRLYLGLWPSILFSFFVIVKEPEASISAVSPTKI